FAARFLQIPRRHGHPCVKLTTTSAFMARDSHPRDYTHAGRTQINSLPKFLAGCFPLAEFDVFIT
ncbi:hypothetical protein M3210_11245, partial [Oceanobacillus luteolus]|uniref:hypothetical protein n=1 Tax=Oceanobacillus luteolus TaxID=1274358 RepID=UPI00203C6568